MASTKRNPRAGGAGARKNDLVGTKVDSELTRSILDFQANFVAQRFRVPLAIAAVIAAHAFYGRRA